MTEVKLDKTAEIFLKVYTGQLRKFPDQTREDTTKKLLGEIEELIEARERFIKEPTESNLEKIKFERADVAIMAVRLWYDYADPLAWVILYAFSDWETLKYVEKKWEIVEARTYEKIEDGTYQHKQ